MAEEKLLNKLANVPLAQPGFDSLGISAPVIVQLNPDGRWSKKKPECLDEERMKAIVQYLVNSNAISSAKSYCCKCAQENKNPAVPGSPSKNYVPVIMMPIYPADDCPFDMKCEIEKMRRAETKPEKKSQTTKDTKDEKDEKTPKHKKRGFVLQRLTDFDLLSQW